MSQKKEKNKAEKITDTVSEEEAQYRRAKILTKPLPQILDEMDASIEAAAEAARRAEAAARASTMLQFQPPTLPMKPVKGLKKPNKPVSRLPLRRQKLPPMPPAKPKLSLTAPLPLRNEQHRKPTRPIRLPKMPSIFLNSYPTKQRVKPKKCAKLTNLPPTERLKPAIWRLRKPLKRPQKLHL